MSKSATNRDLARNLVRLHTEAPEYGASRPLGPFLDPLAKTKDAAVHDSGVHDNLMLMTDG